MSRWLADRKTTNRRFRKRQNCARGSGHSFMRRSHMDADSKKKAAALAALDYVEDGMTVGVGTGSTVNHFIAALKDRRQRIAGAVSSSDASTRLLQEAGIEVRALNDTGDLSLYVDGADEATRHLALIKGGGGALTREKIVAAACRRFVCIVDDSKLVDVLGRFPLPVEVIPMARSLRSEEHTSELQSQSNL